MQVLASTCHRRVGCIEEGREGGGGRGGEDCGLKGKRWTESGERERTRERERLLGTEQGFSTADVCCGKLGDSLWGLRGRG
jgi:hypothetical protein